MAYSPLGFSLPDLSITGSAGTRAAWGGTLGVVATVVNTGTSTITNPIAQSARRRQHGRRRDLPRSPS